MNQTQPLHDLRQSIWLDNITRGLLDDGTLARYIAHDNVTGLTSNPSIFDKAMTGGHDYDPSMAARLAQGQAGEDLSLLVFEGHGELAGPMAQDGGDCEQVIARFNAAGIDEAKLATRLQREGAAKFVRAWNDLLDQISQKSAGLLPEVTRHGVQV